MTALVSMLGEAIERLTKEEVRTHSQTMVDIFLIALDYRTVKRMVGISVDICGYGHYLPDSMSSSG